MLRVAVPNKGALSEPAAEILADLQEAGIPSCKIYSAADIVEDEQYKARDAVRRVPDPEHGQDILHSAPVPRFMGGNPESIAWPGPAIGAHNSYVLKELLGISEADYARLERDGTI